MRCSQPCVDADDPDLKHGIQTSGTLPQGYRVELLDAFASNSSLAGALGAAHALTGTWRSTVSDMRQVEQLTPADVQQVRTICLITG